jgi:F-type H+-transporting ATPase subunit c
MELAAAKAIGAGLALIGVLDAGVGVGNVGAALVNSIARNPSARDTVFTIGMLGFALTEAIAIYALVVAFIILYAI